MNIKNTNVLQLMKSDDRVETIYPFFNPEFYQFKDVNVKVMPSVLGIQKNIMYGRNITEKVKNEAIIPNYFLIDNRKIFTKDLLGKKIIISNSERTLELNIVGVYESYETNDAFIAVSNQWIINDYIVLSTHFNFVQSMIDEYHIFCNKIYQYDNSFYDELHTYKGLYKYVNLFFKAILFISILIIFFIVKDFICHYEKNIAVLKVYGYPNYVIIFGIIFGLLFIYICSILPLLFLACILTILNHEMIKLLIRFFSFCLSFILISLCSCIVFHHRIRKISIIKLLK